MINTWNYDTEKAVLGSMLLSEDAAADVVELLKPDDFAREAHKIIFNVLAELSKKGQPMDILVIGRVLESTGKLEGIGGEDYLLEIAEFVPSPANALYYAGMVQEYATRRRMQGAANRMLRMVEDGETPDAFTDYLGALIGKVGAAGAFPVIAIGDIHLSEDELDGVPTGWKSFDAMTGTDGLTKKQVTMISADTSRGKSTLMQTMALNMARDGRRVLYVVWADLDEKSFKKRALKMLTGWTRRPETLQYAADFDQAVNELAMGFYDIDFIDAVQERITELEVFFAHLGQHHKKKPYDAIFLDYAQSFELQAKTQNDVDQQKRCARLCAIKCKQLGAPFVIGSQIGDDGKTAYSKEWERVCAVNVVIADDGLLVRKSRHNGGSRGQTIPIRFDMKYGRYEDIS